LPDRESIEETTPIACNGKDSSSRANRATINQFLRCRKAFQRVDDSGGHSNSDGNYTNARALSFIDVTRPDITSREKF
jgi:hypothetical protein